MLACSLAGTEKVIVQLIFPLKELKVQDKKQTQLRDLHQQSCHGLCQNSKLEDQH